MNSTQTNNSCSVKCISWTAVFVGALVGVGLSFLLNVFSVAIGLTAFNSGADGTTAIAIGGFLGFAIAVIVTTFVTGWTAGHLGKSNCPQRTSGALYGFIAWVLSLIMMVVLAGPLAHYVNASIHLLTNANVMMPNSTGSMNDMAKATFVLFVLFFLGAISSCFGGHFGMTCCKESCSTSKPQGR